MHGYARGIVRGERGFSLVEIAVTVALIGLLAAIAIPSLRGVLPRVRLANNTAILVNEIALARRQAIAQNVNYAIVFDTAAGSYTLWKDWKPGAPPTGTRLGTNLLNGTKIAAVSGFQTAATVVAFAGGEMNVPLSAGGGVNYGYVTLQTPDDARTSRIRVETLGRVVAER